MVKQRDKIEKEIQELEGALQEREDTEPDYFNDSLKTLQHFVLLTHLRLEQSLQLLIAMDLVVWKRNKANYKNTISFFEKLFPIFDKIEFWNKIKICQEKNLIPGDLVHYLEKVNKYRTTFAHPASYQRELQKYKEREVHFQILKDLVSATKKMDIIFSEKIGVGQIY